MGELAEVVDDVVDDAVEVIGTNSKEEIKTR